MTRLRLGLALVGFLLAFLSMVLNNRQIGWAALAVLLASAIIRLVQRKRDEPDSSSHPGV